MAFGGATYWIGGGQTDFGCRAFNPNQGNEMGAGSAKLALKYALASYFQKLLPHKNMPSYLCQLCLGLKEDPPCSDFRNILQAEDVITANHRYSLRVIPNGG